VRTSELPDVDLVAQARAGDKQAFVDLVARHQWLLRGLCRRMLGEPQAEDAAQEAILQALLALDVLRQPEQFGTWLAGIGLNICRRWLRRQGQVGSLDALIGGEQVYQALETLVPDPAWSAEENELNARVRAAVRALPSGQRSAVALFYLAGLSHAEMAAALGIPIGAVKTRLHKGRQNLRHQLWTLWEEVHPVLAPTPQHETPDDEFVDVHVIDVRRVLPNQDATIARNVMLLQEASGAGRILGIWIGAFESEAVLLLLEGVEMPRPLTYAYANNLLEAAGGRLVEVRVYRLADDTFYAATVIQILGDQERIVDCRPSDGVALALAVGAPIRVAETVLQEAAKTPEQVEQGLSPDGQRVLGRNEIAQELEQCRQQRNAEMSRLTAQAKERRAARQAH
jgi:RNA polymerase sigma-70 factor (ECF subfamily)